ncbi:hypothetical protein ZHAS_00005722 [Anopheles sinensis]|uniref:Uncharacterized protein n=1 Tax=Anopheles sinensis TaxID=74873 RepID=A0A084VK73_ANOSI|nr:hypothetical protein ZHAS_00005722 [Anopheles sinensis]
MQETHQHKINPTKTTVPEWTIKCSKYLVFHQTHELRNAVGHMAVMAVGVAGEGMTSLDLFGSQLRHVVCRDDDVRREHTYVHRNGRSFSLLRPVCIELV